MREGLRQGFRRGRRKVQFCGEPGNVGRRDINGAQGQRPERNSQLSRSDAGLFFLGGRINERRRRNRDDERRKPSKRNAACEFRFRAEGVVREARERGFDGLSVQKRKKGDGSGENQSGNGGCNEKKDSDNAAHDG